MSEAKAMMRQASPEWISGRVAALLSHYWRSDDPAHLAEAVMVDWIEALSRFPQWAIAGAVRKWHQTSAGKRPVPSLIVALCDEETKPLRECMGQAQARLDRALEPPRPAVSAEERARVAAMVANMFKRIPGDA